MSPITSHVLDTALGRPAVGLRVRLDVLDADGHARTVAERVTNDQGRVTDFVPPGTLGAQTYRLTFDTGGYFAASGRPQFYPHVDVVFTVVDADEHHHIPLLLSPFGYSTYRGSMTRSSTKRRSISTRSAPPTARSCRRIRATARRGSRSTPSTAARSCSRPRPRRASARWRARRWTPTAARRPTSPAASASPRDPDGWLATTVHERVRRKLEREPVEDFRIDFEDGFGARPDAEEDATAISAAREVARGMREGALPPFVGIRIKSFGEEWKARSARTLEIFLDTLFGETGGRLPANFVVTLPKVTVAEQPRTLVRLFEILERRHGLAEGTLRLRADDRGHAGDHRRRRPIAAARLPRRVRGPLRRPPTSAPTTTPRRATSPRRSR